MPDLCNQQDVCTRTYLYADDAKIYRVINQISDQADLQAVVNTVKNWSDEWLLRLNYIDECKTVSYYVKNPICTQCHITHENNTHILDKLDLVNDLGVIFDSNLSFRDHISHKINKAYSILGISVVTTIELSPPPRWLTTIEPPPPPRCCTVFSAVFSLLFPENCRHYPQSSYIVSKCRVIWSHTASPRHLPSPACPLLHLQTTWRLPHSLLHHRPPLFADAATPPRCTKWDRSDGLT